MKKEYSLNLPNHWEDTALIFEAIGSPIRQRILLIFEKDEELTIKEIASLFSISRTSIVFHLNILEKAGILQKRSFGREALYKLNAQPLAGALALVLQYIKEEIE
ncbi:ArsR/SmtB family transcription factor [Neisseria sp. Ec49-e6-T10]|uniref:ArsR/SmtB family transcription factor n=1 Tax=Neisseria sp. Ec49-e6-T10 TaxID=3140744 RepID=UPI003EBC9F20